MFEKLQGKIFQQRYLDDNLQTHAIEKEYIYLITMQQNIFNGR